MSVLRRHWFALLVIAAAAIRLPRPFPLWYDEAFTAWLARLPLDRAIEATRGDVHPPLFYLLEWLVMQIPGATDTALRLAPAVASVISLVLARKIAQRLKLPEAAQVGGLVLMAISGWQLYYAQEARSYSLLMLFFLIGILAVLHRRWVWLGAAFTGLLFTHNYGVVYCVVLGVWALAGEIRLPVHSCVDLPWFPERQPESNWKAPLIAGAGALAVYAPWFVFATLGQMREFQDHWIWPPTPADVLATLVGFLYGQVEPSLWTLLVALSGMALSLCVVWRVLTERDHVALLLAYLSLAPIGLAFALSYVVSPLYLYRALIGASVPFYLLIGWALTERVPVRSQAWAVALLLPLVALAGARDVMRERAVARFQPQTVAAFIDQHWQPGDVVYNLNLYSRVELEQYLGERAGYILPLHTTGLDKGGLTLRTRSAMGLLDLEAELDTLPYQRAWLIVVQAVELDQTPARDALLSTHGSRLALTLEDEEKQNRVEIYLLTPKESSHGNARTPAHP